MMLVVHGPDTRAVQEVGGRGSNMLVDHLTPEEDTSLLRRILERSTVLIRTPRLIPRCMDIRHVRRLTRPTIAPKLTKMDSNTMMAGMPSRPRQAMRMHLQQATPRHPTTRSKGNSRLQTDLNTPDRHTPALTHAMMLVRTRTLM